MKDKKQNKKPNKEQEYLNNWKKAQADLENFQKEVAKKMEEFAKFSSREIFSEMTGVMDNLDMARKYAKGNLKSGLDQVLGQFLGIMDKYGVKNIEVKPGDKFDPNLHEAVEGDGDTVQEIVRPGYTMHDRVLRPVRVKLDLVKQN